MKVTQEQALEALNRMRRNASVGISSNDYEIMNLEGYAMDMDTHFEDVETLRQYIEGRELFIPCDEGTAPAISRATDERGHKVVILAEEIYDGLTCDLEPPQEKS